MLKLTLEQMRRIRSDRRLGMSFAQLGLRYQMSETMAKEFCRMSEAGMRRRAVDAADAKHDGDHDPDDGAFANLACPVRCKGCGAKLIRWPCLACRIESRKKLHGKVR